MQNLCIFVFLTSLKFHIPHTLTCSQGSQLSTACKLASVQVVFWVSLPPGPPTAPQGVFPASLREPDFTDLRESHFPPWQHKQEASLYSSRQPVHAEAAYKETTSKSGILLQFDRLRMADFLNFQCAKMRAFSKTQLQTNGLRCALFSFLYTGKKHKSPGDLAPGICILTCSALRSRGKSAAEVQQQ